MRDEDRYDFGAGPVAMLFALPAEALTIANADPKPHTVRCRAEATAPM